MLNGIQDFADRLLERRELIPARGFLTHIAMYIVHIYITVVPLYATSAISNAIPSCKPFVSLSHIGARVREFWSYPYLGLLLRQEAEVRQRSEKFPHFQSYKYDNTTAIDVLTTLLYTSSTSAELALAVTVVHHASQS